MKSQSFYSLLSLIFAFLFTFSLNAQDDVSADSTGYPGDGFSLEGALELFKESESLEDFEKKLNSEDSSVNNLDLNEDGEVDYIRVVDNMEDKVHAVILTVPMSEKESQDIAVIEIEDQGKENTILQIVGDEDVYGEETYVEPYEEEADESDGKGGPLANARIARVVVSVHLWPCVMFMYRPAYVVYVSPWGWGVHPAFWHPWHPSPWHVYHSRVVIVHRRSFRRVHTHRVVHAHRVYTPHRRTTVVVRTRTTTVRTSHTHKRTTSAKKTTTANRKTNANNKNNTRTNQNKSTSGNRSTQQKSSQQKSSSGNKNTQQRSSQQRSSQQKSTQQRSSQQRSSQQRSTQQRSSQQRSSQQRSSAQRSGGGSRGGGGRRR